MIVVEPEAFRDIVGNRLNLHAEPAARDFTIGFELGNDAFD